MQNLQTTKNTINRHSVYAKQLKALVDSKAITKKHALKLFKDYLEQSYGKKLSNKKTLDFDRNIDLIATSLGA